MADENVRVRGQRLAAFQLLVMEQLLPHGVPLLGGKFLRGQIGVQQEAFDHVKGGILPVPLVQPPQKEQFFLDGQAVRERLPGVAKQPVFFHRVVFLPGGVQRGANRLRQLVPFGKGRAAVRAENAVSHGQLPAAGGAAVFTHIQDSLHCSFLFRERVGPKTLPLILTQGRTVEKGR